MCIYRDEETYTNTYANVQVKQLCIYIYIYVYKYERVYIHILIHILRSCLLRYPSARGASWYPYNMLTNIPSHWICGLQTWVVASKAIPGIRTRGWGEAEAEINK